MNKILEQEQRNKLNKRLPSWAIKPHPTRSNMTVIHPMAVIERLNEVFFFFFWNFTTEYIKCENFIQSTKNGDREMFRSAVKGRLEIPEYGVTLEQFGGSSNDDMGDSLKGGATDSLTKIASYLNIGAEIYKGAGNIDYGTQPEPKSEFKTEVDNFDL